MPISKWPFLLQFHTLLILITIKLYTISHNSFLGTQILVLRLFHYVKIKADSNSDIIEAVTRLRELSETNWNFNVKKYNLLITGSHPHFILSTPKNHRPKTANSYIRICLDNLLELQSDSLIYKSSQFISFEYILEFYRSI